MEQDKKYTLEDWKKLFLFDSENRLTDEQLNILLNPKFNQNQLHQIVWGLKHSLSFAEVSFYADPKFDSKQMQEIRYGLEDDLDKSLIEIYAKPEYDAMQMNQMRYGFKRGLSHREVRQFANLSIPWDEMESICKKLERNKEKEDKEM